MNPLDKVWEVVRRINNTIPKRFRGILIKIDRRLKITPFSEVGNGERMVIMNWDEAEKLSDFGLLAHLQRYWWVSKSLQGLRVLDVGCGTGYGSYYLATHGARDVIGIDISREAINFAIKHWSAQNLRFVVLDATNLENIEKFDSIVSFEVIEHIYDQEKFVTAISNALESGGKFYISTPKPKKHQNKQSIYHVHELQKHELEKLLLSEFSDVHIFGQDIIINGVRQKVQSYDHIFKVDKENITIVDSKLNDVFTLIAVCKK